MAGLLKKDCYQILSGGRISLAMGVLFAFLYSIWPDFTIYGLMPVLMWGNVVNNLVFLRDETSGWLKYARTLPVSGGKIVLSYYLLSWAGAAVFLIFQILLGLVFKTPLESLLTVILLSIISACAYFSVELALGFRFGVQYQRLIMFMMIAIIMVASSVAMVLETEEVQFPHWMGSPAGFAVVFLVCLALSWGSYSFSVHAYTQRDLP